MRLRRSTLLIFYLVFPGERGAAVPLRLSRSGDRPSDRPAPSPVGGPPEVTLFSAPNYCGEFDNAGAMMTLDERSGSRESDGEWSVFLRWFGGVELDPSPSRAIFQTPRVTGGLQSVEWT